MPRWTPEARQKQAEKIQAWKPWFKGGVKTPAGKAISSQNALKHGYKTAKRRLEMKELRREVREAIAAIKKADKIMERWRERRKSNPS